MDGKTCFVSVEFVDDPNVRGLCYWYSCSFDGAEEGDKVIAPLGRHNRLQEGVIRHIMYAEAERAPYPVNYIKSIRKLIKGRAIRDVSNS